MQKKKKKKKKERKRDRKEEKWIYKTVAGSWDKDNEKVITRITGVA